MNLLVATNGYPTTKNPTKQVFVKNIYEGLRKHNSNNINIGIVYNIYFKYFNENNVKNNVLNKILKLMFSFFTYLPFVVQKANKYDIIYSHGVLFSTTYMCIASKIYKKKLVCYVHGGDVNAYSKKNGISKSIISITLRNCDLIVTNSIYQKKRLIKEYGVESEVITPGYNDDVYFFNPSDTDRTTDVLFAGNAIQRKGIDILLKAVGNHYKYYKNNGIRIKIHCSGPLKETYIRAAESLNLDGIISFGDRLKEDELAQEYRNSKIFVFPSREEPLGMVGIEAIASGAVLIASNTGGIKEYVKHGENGFLFSNEDPDELHRLIEHALETYCEYKSRLYASSKSVSEYTLKEGINRTWDLFSSFIKEV